MLDKNPLIGLGSAMLLRILLFFALFLAWPAQAQERGAPPIIVDQFGYLPALEKVAVIKNPKVGFDRGRSFTPGREYGVIDKRSGKMVFKGTPQQWAGGKTDEASGDQIWHFDFTAVRTSGRYAIRDLERGVESYPFTIAPDVYTPVLKLAFKTMYLQRAGFEKTPKFAGPWADSASHVGRGQDTQARLFNRTNDGSTARDLRGGWYDAGDYNRYTSWTANYVKELLGAYSENPSVWTDNFEIPESGNGIPDILDEVKWGLDWLERMQNPDGSMLSVLGVADASPPSRSKGPSRYGPPNSSATVTSAGAFAMAARIYGSIGQESEAKRYASRADKAWKWYEANPRVKFYNNDPKSNSEGLAAGQQEVEAERMANKVLIAAIQMKALHGDPYFDRVIERLYRQTNPVNPETLNGFEAVLVFDLLFHANQPQTPSGLATQIKRDFEAKVLNGYNGWPVIQNKNDPYRAHIGGYWWGSNGIKSRRGMVYTQAITANLGSRARLDYLNAASGYLNYIHGVNPLNKVYLSNMGRYGAENSVSQFYHNWFKDGTKYDEVGVSRIGPAPGFLVGGPNDGYSRNECCNASCGGDGDRLCRLPVKSPPSGQPAAKSYTDFNEGWPLNSWEVSENSLGYQTPYLRLLSKFAR